MKNLKFSLLILATFFATSMKAQRTCGSFEHLQEMMVHDPDFKTNRDKIEQQTADYVSNPTKHLRAVVNIPVVFHIVYNTAAQNVSDAQIQSQLTVLNADYRKLNTDISLLPSVFSGLAADCEVQFCLAQQTPTGAATTGIVRKSTTITSFSTNDAVKYSAQGGDDIWDRNKYLNIWVCNLSGGVLGYAQFPGGAAATDGVVITYTGFGTTGTAAAPFNKGRTATHEVGHWLNLYHIWGDDGTACTGSDQVSDTPNQGSENYGCPTFPHISCSNGPNGDLFMNYMDYSDDACMYMFTSGQKARMAALFATGGARNSLLISPGCTPGSTGATCSVPTSLTAGSVTTTSAILSWGAVSGATSYKMQYKTSSATTWTTVTTTSNSYSLSGLTASTTYNYQVQTVCSGGSSAYSTASSFTTLASGSACSNSYEPNNTLATAISVATNTNLLSQINSSTDNDYYKITTTSAAPKLKVTLSTLPADYDLRLYNSSGTLLASSALASTTSESITYNTATAGATYYIYVLGYNGAYSTTNCYTLKASTSATNWRLEGSVPVNDVKPEWNIYPNPANDKLNVQFVSTSGSLVTANIYNAVGQRVLSVNERVMEGENNLTFNLSLFSKGMYMLEMIQNGERKSQRFLIEK